MPLQSRASDILQSRVFGHVVRWTIVLALWTLLISMAIGRFGISNYIQLRENADTLAHENMLLSIENQLIEERIEELKSSPAARSQFLQEEFGLVQPHQRVVHFRKLPQHPSPPRSTLESRPQVAQKHDQMF